MDQRLSLITLGVRDVARAQASSEALGRHLDGDAGVFVDPDGHPWEVAHDPAWTVHEDGRTTLD